MKSPTVTLLTPLRTIGMPAQPSPLTFTRILSLRIRKEIEDMENNQQADLCLGAGGIREPLGVSVRQVRNFITNGDSPVFKSGGRVCAL